jgi:hypothetical protein
MLKLCKNNTNSANCMQVYYKIYNLNASWHLSLNVIFVFRHFPCVPCGSYAPMNGRALRLSVIPVAKSRTQLYDTQEETLPASCSCSILMIGRLNVDSEMQQGYSLQLIQLCQSWGSNRHSSNRLTCEYWQLLSATVVTNDFWLCISSFFAYHYQNRHNK